jgi:uncharacterized protein YndB with AHSA1/START domain
MESPSPADRIEKQIVLKAPRARVWRALADAEEFGRWFGVRFAEPFSPGARMRGKVTYPDYEGLDLEMFIERMEPERRFSFRWHPFAVDPKVDFSGEPMTLVEFTLEEAAGGTRLTVVESGFDRIPLARRAEAFRMNDEGWAEQLEAIARHLAEAR